MPREWSSVPANELEFAYESFGEASDPPLLLIMGLGAQMIAWPDEVCESLAQRGHFVVRFDNRDVGLSTHLPQFGTPSPLAILARRLPPPYTVEDMADDTAALLEALKLPSAHVVGASMGGFIAQAVAIRHPERVRSLTLIMTSTGSRRVGHPRPKVAARLLRRRPATDRQSAVAAVVSTFRLIGSPGYRFDEARVADLAGRSYDRAYDPGGYLRQLAAVSAQLDRSQQLRGLRVPTVVVHGMDDPLVSVSGGRALARAIPSAQFVGFPGMGHDLPQPLWGRFVEEISSVAAIGESERSPHP